MPATPLSHPRFAGLAYLGIIALGLGAELGIRLPVTSAADPVAALQENLGLWRLAIGADMLMATLDITLALLLYQMFRAQGPNVALAALVLRLVQMAVIAAHLPLLASSIGAADPSGLIDRHAAGYDLGLWFFGLNAMAMAVLLHRAGLRWLTWLIGAAGLVYLIGSFTRFVAPEINALMQPAYLIPVLAEFSFALWLLISARARIIAAQG